MALITELSHVLLGENAICEVLFKELKSFPDDRGFFREIIRHNDEFFQNGFAQWSHSKMAHNTVKAWHYHHLQTDWWYVPIGVVHVVLFDNRQESPTLGRKLEFKLGEADLDAEVLSAVVKIPPGVLHGCKVLSDTAHLMYITNSTYRSEEEGRYPFNSSIAQHCWGNEAELIVSERDRKSFVPPHPRKPCGTGR